MNQPTNIPNLTQLVVDTDPCFQWKDQFRQARSSNDSRQTLLYRLDATVRRMLGRKVCAYGCVVMQGGL